MFMATAPLTWGVDGGFSEVEAGDGASGSGVVLQATHRSCGGTHTNVRTDSVGSSGYRMGSVETSGYRIDSVRSGYRVGSVGTYFLWCKFTAVVQVY